ncbi:toll/interleukin-1 receptor domain-containing protein [Streptomyces sp. RS10V-4]|uniref:toll/interleukin-1 receptor domain-containing protein n=1 Tax=Streptomyces rhizoryzae TaxID=2932493 RepID=UPI002005CEFF|nr:toll/interleukin-1 receptor domain-containing protein [Streptomyces rhizoryzae]MCK7625969.1 toll/interleukin-1 receptor domain-containing protein [Streptomyces rhizoryzae]
MPHAVNSPATPTSRPEIFINYRTADEAWCASRLAKELGQRFGADRVFWDGDSLRGGDRYPEALVAAVRQCSVLLAVIGERWLHATDARGGRALDNPEDWTRREIIDAFDWGIRVIPVLVSPRLGPFTRADLPPELAELADVQFRRLNPREPDAELDRLGDELASLVPALAAVDSKAETTAAEPDRPRGVRNSLGDVHGTAVQAGRYDSRQSGGYRTTTGSGGTVVNGATGPVNIGGAQHNAPVFFGDGANYAAGDFNGDVQQRFGEHRGHEGDGR